MISKLTLGRRRFLLTTAATGLTTALARPRLGRAQGEAFRIGALNPVTGAGGTYGPGMQKTIIFAAEEVNEAGGAGGRTLEVIAEDTQTSPEAAVLAAKKLIEVNGVKAILGTWSSGVTLAVLPIAVAADVILMNTSGAPAISTEDKKDLVWRFQATNDRFGQAFAKIADMRGYQRPATMAFNNASGVGNAEGFRKAWEGMGREVVASVVYEPERPSYRSELQQVLAANPDVIVMGSYLPDTTIILREWYQSGADNAWIIPGWAANPQLVEALGPEVTQGVIAVDMVPNEQGDAFARYAERYEEATGMPGGSNVYAAMAYDMVISLALAMEAAGPDADVMAINGRIRDVSNPPGTTVTGFEEGKAALQAGEEIDYDGASSRLDFDEYGDVTPDFSLSVVQASGDIVREDVVQI